MKRIVLIWMAAFLMGGMAMAQHARHSDKMPEPKVRAERMTERMVKEYSLNDTQKQQLLEANLALVEKMGDMPMHRAKAHKHHKRDGKRHQLTDDARGVYRLNKKECAGCLMCVGFCPENVMVQCDDYLEPSKCTACGLCVKACPTGAIRLVEE